MRKWLAIIALACGAGVAEAQDSYGCLVIKDHPPWEDLPHWCELDPTLMIARCYDFSEEQTAPSNDALPNGEYTADNVDERFLPNTGFCPPLPKNLAAPDIIRGDD